MKKDLVKMYILQITCYLIAALYAAEEIIERIIERNFYSCIRMLILLTAVITVMIFTKKNIDGLLEEVEE